MTAFSFSLNRPTPEYAMCDDVRFFPQKKPTPEYPHDEDVRFSPPKTGLLRNTRTTRIFSLPKNDRPTPDPA